MKFKDASRIIRGITVGEACKLLKVRWYKGIENNASFREKVNDLMFDAYKTLCAEGTLKSNVPYNVTKSKYATDTFNDLDDIIFMSDSSFAHIGGGVLQYIKIYD